MRSPIFNNSVDQLATLLEEGARASTRSVEPFIEPIEGTLRRAQSKRHHVVFGRRGSGKSSLLLKTVSTLTESDIPVAYVDLEPFKGHHYPDVLISVLLAALIKFQERLTDRGPFLGPRTWRTLWLRRTKTTKSELRTEVERLMANTIEDLRGQLYLTDEAPVLTTRKSGLEATESAKAKAAAKGKFQTLESSLEAEIASQKKSSH